MNDHLRTARWKHVTLEPGWSFPDNMADASFRADERRGSVRSIGWLGGTFLSARELTDIAVSVDLHGLPQLSCNRKSSMSISPWHRGKARLLPTALSALAFLRNIFHAGHCR